ncbi:MAG TPA: cytochrome c biogenesis protein CcsA [Isosphaeraceae bacterium]|nr:cytochrome c biogenesis protein CcsA [Isosphaeraceae bacterium]
MKRFGWLTLGLALAIASGDPVRGAEGPKPFGVGPTYEALAKLPVMSTGRKKPLDTLAREEVKQIYGRETIKLSTRGDGKDRVVAAWGPVAALFDWSVRPEFWDDQPIILVSYLPLKRLILADALLARLATIANRAETSAADRAEASRLAADQEISPAALGRFAASAHLSAEDRNGVEALAEEMSEGHRWLTPSELEQAQITVGGQRIAFEVWFRDLADKERSEEADVTGKAKLAEIEKRALEVGKRLVHYQAIRGRATRSVEPMLIMPRPSSPAYIGFLGKTVEKARQTGGIEGLSPLELEGAKALDTYWNDIPIDDREVPGTDRKFDERFAAWLKHSSVWIPLRVLLDSKPEDLAAAGFPADRVAAFRTSFREMEEAEKKAPGAAPESKAAHLLASARALGESINKDGYPSAKAMDLETYFNETNPFWTAPYGYGLALALLAASLGFTAMRRRSPLWWTGVVLYAVGMIGLALGIALEVAGFAMRVRISGWAPVTNMYETVIWVSLVAAVLGLAFEAIYRRTFPALAGSGVALLGTVLAANVPLLDPSIKTLQPVLRSNYWLTIHVLTEVSSYAAFALAMALGLIATLYYLTATYRRSPSYLELGSPLFPGVPLLILGAIGIAVSYGSFGLQLPKERVWSLYYIAAVPAALGGIMTIVGGAGMVGEAIARACFRRAEGLDEAALARGESSPAATAVQTVTVGESSGAVATLAKPTVAEIRAMAAQGRPKLDARGRAMQATAAQIKPLANFIYRAMQVGVLLVAAGTILGGVWADYSWGRFWGWDPKEVWALITLLVYLIPLHGRFAGWVNTFGLVMASVGCFLSVIMAWYGVNFVLGVGLHSYGFVEGGSQGVVGAVVLAVLAVAAAAAWRRALASRVPTGSA